MDLRELNKNIKELPKEEAILNIIQQKIDNEMNAFSKEIQSFKSEFSSLKWLIGIGFTVIGLLIAFLNLFIFFKK